MVTAHLQNLDTVIVVLPGFEWSLGVHDISKTFRFHVVDACSGLVS